MGSESETKESKIVRPTARDWFGARLVRFDCRSGSWGSNFPQMTKSKKKKDESWVLTFDIVELVQSSWKIECPSQSWSAGSIWRKFFIQIDYCRLSSRNISPMHYHLDSAISDLIACQSIYCTPWIVSVRCTVSYWMWMICIATYIRNYMHLTLFETRGFSWVNINTSLGWHRRASVVLPATDRVRSLTSLD